MVTRRLFGTDGVRGRTNIHPITAAMALRLGQAAGLLLARNGRPGRVVIGKDTRRSGYMLESALEAGLTSVGAEVLLLGPLPTPAVGLLTRSLRADLGVMISASHNPYEDNGIKFFGADGYKLSDADEAELERLIEAEPMLAAPDRVGKARRVERAVERYVEAAKSALPRGLRLDGLKVVVDCANGAAYRTAPAVLWELGAEVEVVGGEPNGVNINAGCGSTAPEACQRRVVETGADLGIALDGDADRVHLVDERGRLIDGDQLMALIATRWAAAGRLAHATLVATVMSNLGLERHLAAHGLALVRTKVGDRYVVEAMRAGGYNLGGEQSGHIVLGDFTTTGDGLMAALQAMAALVEGRRPASEALDVFAPMPQLLRNLRIEAGARPLETAEVRAAIAAAETQLAGRGRLVIRASGTEPVIRVMAEADDDAVIAAAVGTVCDALGTLAAEPAAGGAVPRLA
jgi:phosphoglucosamine mutase